MCGGGCNTSSATTAANPDAQAAYTDVVGKAQSVANTPYQPYGGQLVAGLNAQQNRSIGQLANAYGSAQPYVDQANAGLGNVQQYLQGGSQGLAAAANYGNASSQALGGIAPYMGMVQGALGGAAGAFGQEQAGLGAAGNYFSQAAGLAAPQSFDAAAVSQYMSPYLSSVVDATRANLNENNAQQRQGLVANAIGSGAYGGDRAGVAQAELARQQSLADGQTIAGLYDRGYSNAESQFNAVQGQRQQGASLLAGLGQATTQNALGYGNVGSGYLGAASGYNTLAQDQGQIAQQYGTLGQLSLGAASGWNSLGTLQGTTAQAYGGLGSTAQANLISGASAGLQGGTLRQQNAQQQDTALYNQYMSGLSYPYQNVGFLSNIVQGIGSQEGNTQTTQGNALSSIAGLGTSAIGILGATGGFGANGYLSGLGSSLSSAFSDARVKDDIASIGTTHDGQPIYRFRYKGDPRVQMGLMAQDVERRDPGAVGEVGGIKTVDYDRATRGAAAIGLGTPSPLAGGGAERLGLGLAARMARADGGPVPGLGTPSPVARAPVGLNVRPMFADGGAAPIPSGGLNVSPAGLLSNGPINLGTPLNPGRPIQAAPASGQGLGAVAMAPGAGGGSPAGGFGSSPNLGTPAPGNNSSGGGLGGVSQNAWMGVLAAGLGMMGGASASATANIGRGALEGLQMYQGLQQQDRNNSYRQDQLALENRRADQQAAYQSGSLALDKQKEDFTERRTQQMLDAAQRASEALTAGTAPAAPIQPVTAPSGTASVAVHAQVSRGASPSGAPVQGGWMPNTIPDSAAPVPTAASPQSQGAASGAASDFWANVSPDSNPLILTQRATQFTNAGKSLAAVNPEGANQYFTQAQQLQSRARQIYDTGKVMLRDGSVGVLPGFNDAAASMTAATKSAEATVSDQHDLVKVADPNGGGEQYMPKSVVMRAAQGGGLPSSVPPGAGSAPGSGAAAVANAAPYLASNPKFIEQAQAEKAKSEAEMDQQFQARQIARQRLTDLRGIMTRYETGDLAGAKAGAVALGRAIGIPVSDTATASPEFFQRFVKDATANTFDSVKAMGGRVLVSEIEGLTKANANAEASPAANAAILSQGLGTLDYEDQHYKDYMGWRDQNPNAWNASRFEIGWQGKNNLQSYVDKAGKDFAYRGQTIPPDPGKRSVGQMYMTPAGPRRWMGQGWASN